MIRHFGKEIVAGRVHAPESDPKVDTLWLKLYKVDPTPLPVLI